jgi:transcriptional regulator with XRE-family HTH domain
MTYTDPTVRSQELGAELRALRESSGLTLTDSARHIDASVSKLSRIESGMGSPTGEDVSALLVVYGITGPKRREILALAREAERRGWWQRNRPGYADRLRTLVALESNAEAIVNFETVVVPGLLQTGEYTRAIMIECGYVPSHEVEERMVTRLHRHSLLRRARPPQLLGIIDEPVLHRRIGGRDVLRRQLEHLMNVASQPHIRIRVVPRSVAAHAGIDGAFTLLRRPHASPVVFLENLTSSLFLEESAEIDKYESALRTLSEQALDERQSVEMINALANRLDTEASRTCDPPR